MSANKIFIFLISAYLLGLILASFFNQISFLKIEAIILAFFLPLIFKKEKKILIFSFCLLLFALGIIRAENLPPGPNLSFLKEKLNPIKEFFKEKISQNFPFSNSVILSALLLGEKREIPSCKKKAKDCQKLFEKLIKAGIEHIVVVSGMHILIISQVLIPLLIFFGFWRKQALLISLFFIWLFIFFIGFQISATRAGILATFLIVSQMVHREKSSLALLLLTGFLILNYNPSFVKNLSFQLSFLATIGIVYFSPLISNYLKIFKRPFSEILSTTISAQLITFPLLIYKFGYLSLFSPLANILILPFLTPLMFLAFFYLPFSLFPFLGKIFSFFIQPFLAWILFVINFISKIPLGLIKIKFNFTQFILCYLLIFLSYFYLKKKLKLKTF